MCAPLSLRVSPDAHVLYCLRVSHGVSACQSRCACFCCLLVLRVVCWLRAGHHVRVLCLGVHHDVNVFGGKGKEISASVLVILREHKCQPLEERRG